jgi:photosystem II protein
MVIGIEFLDGIKEVTLPLIKLTRSRNGKTGTATFIFIQPKLFCLLNTQKVSFDSISLVSSKPKIMSNDIILFFKEGQPFLLKAIFIFKNTTDWFTFLSFMREYSSESGLSFSEK